MSRKTTISTITTAVVTAGIFVSLTLSSVAQTKQSSISDSDKQFITEAAQDGKLEVELGQLAQQRAASSDVKQFAQRMIRDHSQGNNQLKRLAAQKNVTIPSDLDVQFKAVRDMLSNLSGKNFDQTYMKYMVEDHEGDVSFRFPMEAQHGEDRDVKAWAAQTLPTLREHLQMARSIANKPG